MAEAYKKVIATLCYVQKDGKTLMLVRNKKKDDMLKGWYSGLGGKCDKGEDPYNNVIREVRDEAGITIDPIYVANITFIGLGGENEWEVHLFRSNGFSGELNTDCNEGELVWIESSEILNINISDGDRVFLEHLNDDKFFFARIEYKDNKLVSHWIKFITL